MLRVPVPAPGRAVQQVDRHSLRLLGCRLRPRQRGSALPPGKGGSSAEREQWRGFKRNCLLGGRGQESLHPDWRGVETCWGSDWWLCGAVLYSYTELTATRREQIIANASHIITLHILLWTTPINSLRQRRNKDSFTARGSRQSRAGCLHCVARCPMWLISRTDVWGQCRVTCDNALSNGTMVQSSFTSHLLHLAAWYLHYLNYLFA